MLSLSLSLNARWPTQYQARRSNLTQKDSSQETVLSLMGMLVSTVSDGVGSSSAYFRQAGSVIVSRVSSTFTTWMILVLLLVCHLGCNYMAVRSVRMSSFNRQRANIAFGHLLAFDKVLSPDQVSRAERIFERDGVLRWTDGKIIGFAKIGASLRECFRTRQSASAASSGNKATHDSPEATVDVVPSLARIFKDEWYLLWMQAASGQVLISLKQGCSSKAQLQAWCHALALARRSVEEGPNTTQQVRRGAGKIGQEMMLDMVSETLEDTKKTFDEHVLRLASAGWEVDNAALETSAGPRFVCE